MATIAHCTYAPKESCRRSWRRRAAEVSPSAGATFRDLIALPLLSVLLRSIGEPTPVAAIDVNDCCC